MQIKTFTILTCSIFLNVLNLYGQSGTTTKYFSKKSKEVPKEQSYYYEVRREISIDKDTVFTYYTANNQMRSYSIETDNGNENGAFRRYHENGNVKSKGNFKLGWPSGSIISYYPSGSAQAIEVFNSEDHTSMIINYYDSLGNQLVANGTGRCVCVFGSYDWRQTIERGKYTGGKRDSLWIGINSSGKTIFKELYKSDSLISGESYDSLGIVYTYTEIEKQAEPKKGLRDVYERIGRSIRYPAEAKRFGIQGKVFVEFVIEKDGSISNVMCIKGIGAGCDNEAVRVVKLLPPFNPGIQRGQAVRTRFVLPINFKLQ